MNKLFEENKIMTLSGCMIDPLDPDPSLINIMDIAVGLSHQGRFAGHTTRFLSVAEHSISVYGEIKNKFTDNFRMHLAALLHDASEAYLTDIPRPVKHRLPGYREAEERLMKIIAERFDFEYPLPPEVKEADDYVLALEFIALTRNKEFAIHHPEMLPNAPSVRYVRARFLDLFDILSNAIQKENYQ